MSNVGISSNHDITSSKGAIGGGFNFDNMQRNQMIMEKYGQGASSQLPYAKKTGTTISGLVYADGVILACDTRSTSGEEIAEKNCEKLHYIAPNIYCAGAGTAADTMKTTELIASQLTLLRYDMYDGNTSRVITAVTKLKRLLFRYQGHIGAALILGGVDPLGPHLYHIYPHGSTGRLPYAAMGSGSLAAMAVLESNYTPQMNEPDAVKLIQRSITAGIRNDLGSGGSCDVVIIRSDGTLTYTKQSLKENEVAPYRSLVQRSNRFNMTPGLTPILRESFQTHTKPLFLTDSGLTLNDVTVTEMEVDE